MADVTIGGVSFTLPPPGDEVTRNVWGAPVNAILTALAAGVNGAATPAQVANMIASLVGQAPAALDTLKELADALGDDANFAATVLAKFAALSDVYATQEQLGNYVPKPAGVTAGYLATVGSDGASLAYVAPSAAVFDGGMDY